MALDSKTTTIRTLSGLVYILIVIGLLLWRDWGGIVLAVILSMLASTEFLTICSSQKSRYGGVIRLLDVAACGFAAASMLIFPAFIAVFLIFLRLCIELFDDAEKPLRRVAFSMMSIIYIAIPLAILGFYQLIELALPVFILIWVNDTGAFLVGCTLGRHKLFERVSPKKTWEGFLGGMMFCIITGIIFAQYWLPGSMLFWIGFALIACISGTMGDLFESFLKRNLKLKDSGHIMPGHGGILDRIDSLIFALPATMLYVAVMTRGFSKMIAVI